MKETKQNEKKQWKKINEMKETKIKWKTGKRIERN